jgi:hypothetical protein
MRTLIPSDNVFPMVRHGPGAPYWLPLMGEAVRLKSYDSLFYHNITAMYAIKA